MVLELVLVHSPRFHHFHLGRHPLDLPLHRASSQVESSVQEEDDHLVLGADRLPQERLAGPLVPGSCRRMMMMSHLLHRPLVVRPRPSEDESAAAASSAAGSRVGALAFLLLSPPRTSDGLPRLGATFWTR